MAKYKLGSQVRANHMLVLKMALEADPSIVTSEAKLKEHPGCTEAYLDMLGLDRNLLKRLERIGFARRGYVKHKNQYGKAGGHKVRWVLIADGMGE